jgi:hypothetical protein
MEDLERVKRRRKVGESYVFSVYYRGVNKWS